LLQSCRLQDTVQRSWREVVARLPGDGGESWSRRVLELSMRTALANHSPTIVLQPLDYVANFTIERAAWSFYQRLSRRF
jgi:hypothetical protein